MTESSNQYLAHYGVKGMKWGVRKDRRGSAKSRAKKMTTKDLSKKVNRARLESDYVRLTSPKRNRAKMIGAAVLTTMATTAVSIAVKKYANKGFNAIDLVQASKTVDTIWDLPISELKKAGF